MVKGKLNLHHYLYVLYLTSLKKIMEYRLTSVFLALIFFSIFIARTCDLNAKFLVFSITCWYGDTACVPMTTWPCEHKQKTLPQKRIYCLTSIENKRIQHLHFVLQKGDFIFQFKLLRMYLVSCNITWCLILSVFKHYPFYIFTCWLYLFLDLQVLLILSF